MLGLDPAIVVKAVEDWNAMCEAGEDPELGFKKEWLVPIQDAPFYGIKIGAQIVGSHAGLYVNNDMQVLDTDCHPIPGLYAGFHTAGGAMGINNTCFTTLGNSGLAWTGGYMAANGVLANEL